MRLINNKAQQIQNDFTQHNKILQCIEVVLRGYDTRYRKGDTLKKIVRNSVVNYHESFKTNVLLLHAYVVYVFLF